MRAVATATLVAGTLDILSAFVFSGLVGISPMAVLSYVASGPFGDQALHGTGWAMAGLLVHYAIMACMAGTYAAARHGFPPCCTIPFRRGSPMACCSGS